MRIWQVFDYFPEGGACPIRDWYDAQIAEVRAAFDATIGELATLDDWEDEVPAFEKLERRPEHGGLCWIRFEVTQGRQKFQYRAVGRWRKEAREFIFLVGLRKNGRPTIPPNALDDAVRLLRQLEQGRGEIHEHFEEEEGMAEDGDGQEVP
jgi:hypothetical protein